MSQFRLSMTTKVHILLQHVPHFIRLTGMPLDPFQKKLLRRSIDAIKTFSIDTRLIVQNKSIVQNVFYTHLYSLHPSVKSLVPLSCLLLSLVVCPIGWQRLYVFCVLTEVFLGPRLRRSVTFWWQRRKMSRPTSKRTSVTDATENDKRF